MQYPYALSEDEFNLLDSTRNQLRLIEHLLMAIPAGPRSGLIDGPDLESFIRAQCEAVTSVVHAVDDRQEERRIERTQYPHFSGEHMMDLIGMLSGAPLSAERMSEVAVALLNTQPDGAASVVFVALADGMRRRGLHCDLQVKDGEVLASFVPLAVAAPVKGKATPRKREKLVTAHA